MPILLSEERSRGAWTFDELEKAFGLLGVEDVDFNTYDTYDSQFIAGLYEGKVKNAQLNNDPVMLENMKRALCVISYAKGNPPDLAQLIQSQTVMTVDQAYNRLEVSDQVDDEMIALIYQTRLEESPGRLDEWSQALRAIALNRNSEMLLRLAAGDGAQGTAEPWTIQADPERPAGLENIGNTCYLNSLLQYFFSLRVVRERVLDYEKQVKDGQPPRTIHRKKVANREVTAREAERSHKCECPSTHKLEFFC